MGFGAIIRDVGGHLVAACTRTQDNIVEPIVAEAWAGLVAVLLCMEKGVFDIILEGDSQKVVNEINKATLNVSRYGHFVDGIKTVLQSL
jgi:ribonuclease HI